MYYTVINVRTILFIYNAVDALTTPVEYFIDNLMHVGYITCYWTPNFPEIFEISIASIQNEIITVNRKFIFNQFSFIGHGKHDITLSH